MTLNLSATEMAVLEALCLEKGVNKTALMRQALRMYQAIETRLSAGERMYFENDETKAKSELLVV